MRHHHFESFECEICGTRFEQEAAARACEEGGRPAPRFSPGDAVTLGNGDYKDQFPGEIFRVQSSDVFLDRPNLEVWQEGEPGRHMVVYILVHQRDSFRLTFVPEHHLAPARGAAYA